MFSEDTIHTGKIYQTQNEINKKKAVSFYKIAIRQIGSDSLDENSDFLIQSAELGLPQAQYLLASILYYKLQITDSFQWFLQSARQGGIPAQKIVANMYLVGDGISVDYKKSFIWIMILARKNIAEYQREVSEYYFKGIGVEKDEIEGIEWLKKASENDDPISKKRLEMMGIKVEENKIENTLRILK